MWEKSNQRKIQFVAARYGLKSIDTELLYCEIKNIIWDLSFYRFYVICISGDGAVENRSVFKRLCTHTAQDILPEGALLANPWIKKDFPLAFQHPHPRLSHIMIFIMGNMPHIAEKLVSPLEMSSCRDSRQNLRVRSNDKDEDDDTLRIFIGLDKLYNIWLRARTAKGSSILIYKFSRDMYIKDANTQMCVHLCTRTFSESQAKMVENCGGPGIQAIVPLLCRQIY